MNDTIRFILSLSISFAVLIGIVRFRKIDAAYYPFIYNITAALVVEIVTRIFMVNGQPEAFEVALNIYSFLDFYLYLWLFHNWGLFNKNKSVFIALSLTFFLVWLTNNALVTGFIRPNFYFFILYSFALIFFSVTAFNKAVVNERISIFRNAKFWICLGIIIFYSFFVVACATSLTLFREDVSLEFRRGLQAINVYSNLLVNLLYAVAVIWVPRKKNFTSLF
jgi:hypothetical protein